MPRLRSGLLLSLMVASLTNQAEAILIEIDLPGGNLNEVTRDTVTGLDWLDLPATVNISFNDAIGAATSSFGSGWRRATGSEVCSLFAREALAPSPCPGNVNAYEDDGGLRVQHLQALLGLTYVDIIASMARGLFDDGTAGSVGFAQLIKNPASVAFVRDDQFSDTSTSADTGNFLVRVIPEPGTGLLVIGGLLGLAVLRTGRA